MGLTANGQVVLYLLSRRPRYRGHLFSGSSVEAQASQTMHATVPKPKTQLRHYKTTVAMMQSECNLTASKRSSTRSRIPLNVQLLKIF